MIKRLTKVRLPDEYQRVEYLESTGTQYIYIPKGFDYTIDSIKCRFMVTSVMTQNMLNGCNDGLLFGYVSTGQWHFGLGSEYVRLNGVDTNWHIVSIDGLEQSLSFDESKHHLTPETGVVKDRFFLFARYVTAPNNFCKEKISYLEWYRNKELYIHLVPCYRKSDNKPGMYDLVSGQFFVNQGTGEFLVGEDVNEPIEVWHTVKSIKRRTKNLLNAVLSIDGSISKTYGNFAGFDPTKQYYISFDVSDDFVRLESTWWLVGCYGGDGYKSNYVQPSVLKAGQRIVYKIPIGFTNMTIRNYCKPATNEYSFSGTLTNFQIEEDEATTYEPFLIEIHTIKRVVDGTLRTITI